MKIAKLLKTNQTLAALLTPVIFFLIWLQPLFVIRWFLSSRPLVYFSKLLIILVSAVGLYGLGRYAMEIRTAFEKSNFNSPSLWFKLPLGLLVLIIVIFFYLPLILT